MKPSVHSVLLALLALVGIGHAATTGPDLVARQSIAMNAPVGEPTKQMARGPLLGNGDVGVMQTGPADRLTFYIGKNDFWSLKYQAPVAVGQVKITTPALQGAEFKATTDMSLAEIRGEYSKGGAALASRAWVDANRNLLCIELSNKGALPLAISLQNSMGAGASGGVPAGVSDDKMKTSAGSSADAGAEFLYDPDAPNPAGRKIGVATRVVGTNGSREFTLAPGNSAVVATAVLSDLDAKGKNPLEMAKALVAALTSDRLDKLTTAHRQWWHDYWSRSFIEIPDKTIEQCWYSSWYIMGSCSREGKVAPGLWGNWLTVDNPAWHGDFHLNYNFQAPFYGLYASNHAETTLPFYDAMNQSIPRGQRLAEKHGWQGIHLPVSIGPWGMCPEGDDSDWGQRSNTAYAALLYGWQWQYTRDKNWLKSTGYPYMREVEKFWTDYLKFQDGRYVIEHDAIHEGSGGAGKSGQSADMNPILSLGLVHALYQNMLGMSEALGVDAGLRPKWRGILEKLSPFPTQEKGGKTVFRYTEKGTAWWNDNTLGIQHIFPASAIGLDSDPKLLEISHNMVHAMGRWRDNNGSSSWYTACARVGYDPKKILAELRYMYDRHTLPNKLLNFGGGGIENVSPALAVTEMLMQSHEGVIRIFPCWPKEQDARFGTLRAVGAFLVSAELKSGIVTGVSITSEKGGDCTLVNPWPGSRVRIIREGKAAEFASGERFVIKTRAGETLAIAPEIP